MTWTGSQQLPFRTLSQKICVDLIMWAAGQGYTLIIYFTFHMRPIPVSVPHRSQPCKVDDAGNGLPEQDFNHSSLRISCCLLLEILLWWLRTRWGR